jgi:hypothetical protein
MTDAYTDWSVLSRYNPPQNPLVRRGIPWSEPIPKENEKQSEPWAENGTITHWLDTGKNERSDNS